MDGSWQVAYGQTCYDYQEDWSPKTIFLTGYEKVGTGQTKLCSNFVCQVSMGRR